MRLLVDECTGPAVAQWLRQQNHEVFSVYEDARGADDDSIIERAQREHWILITNDKDFGEKVYRERRPHRGVVFLRLDDERAASKIETLRLLLERYATRLPDQFVVVTETRAELLELEDLDGGFADPHGAVEHLRERGRGVAGSDVADLSKRVALQFVEFQGRHQASTFSIVSRILGGWKGLVMNDFAPACTASTTSCC